MKKISLKYLFMALALSGFFAYYYLSCSVNPFSSVSCSTGANCPAPSVSSWCRNPLLLPLTPLFYFVHILSTIIAMGIFGQFPEFYNFSESNMLMLAQAIRGFSLVFSLVPILMFFYSIMLLFAKIIAWVRQVFKKRLTADK